MLELDRITTQYSQEEDRLSLTANLREGGTARIWLTQRIANRLIPALLDIIKPKHDDPVYAEVVASIAQQRAVDRHEPTAPVRPQETQHEWLIHKIDLQMPQTGVALILHSADGRCARVHFTTELLRQWLSILKRVYGTTGWKDTAWPAWMEDPPKQDTRPQVLH